MTISGAWQHVIESQQDGFEHWSVYAPSTPVT
jgi:hypothetical protein